MSQEPSQKNVIVVEGLRKIYDGLTAVDSVSFEVKQGEIFGILGPNGAGKTTVLEIVEGLREPTAGFTSVLGHNTQDEPEAVKERIGVQLQASAYFDYLTLKEILDLFGLFYRNKVPAATLLKRVDLQDRADVTVRKLSGGQQQRFTIAAALVNDPEVVFLDEPTTGLDPQARRNLWDFIRSMKSDGRTVVLTTHYMEEAEYLCDRVAIMDNGRIVALDTPGNLISKLPNAFEIVASISGIDDFSVLSSLSAVNEADSGEDGTIRIRTSDAATALSSLMRWAESEGAQVSHLELIPANLEDVFLSLTGRALRE